MRDVSIRVMLGVVAALLLVTAPGEAAVRRFALVVGNDLGASFEVPLSYAESDAQKMASVLRELGGVQPADLVVLTGESVDTVRRTLITINARIHEAMSTPGTDVLLVVYYSGHADADALHLGTTYFNLAELSDLVRGSPAKVRLLIVDACRSGSLTRVKGGSPVAAFDVLAQESLRGEGMALLTASAAGEDAQESDAIGGAFFTHALVSGLRGAADRNHDAVVALDELYAYAYSSTLRATSAAAAGSQHPTFHFDVRGFGNLPLAQLATVGPNRAWLRVPPDLQVLVLKDDNQGEVIAEVGEHDVARRLSLRTGKYFLRARERDHLLEGTVELPSGADRQVEASELTRFAYAQLVRRGGSPTPSVSSYELGGMLRTARVSRGPWCWGTAASYGREWGWGGLRARLGYCAGAITAPSIETQEHEYSLGVTTSHTWDFGRFGLSASITLGGAVSHQMFDTYQQAPSRLAAVGFAAAGVGLRHYFLPSWYVGIEPQLEQQLFRYQATALEETQLDSSTTGRAVIYVGLH